MQRRMNQVALKLINGTRGVYRRRPWGGAWSSRVRSQNGSIDFHGWIVEFARGNGKKNGVGADYRWGWIKIECILSAQHFLGKNTGSIMCSYDLHFSSSTPALLKRLPLYTSSHQRLYRDCTEAWTKHIPIKKKNLGMSKWPKRYRSYFQNWSNSFKIFRLLNVIFFVWISSTALARAKAETKT